MWMNPTPQTISRALGAFLTVGIAQSAAVVGVSSLVGKLKGHDDDDDYNKALGFMTETMETLTGIIPGVTELQGGIYRNIFDRMGANQKARLRQYRLGRNTLLGPYVENIDRIFAGIMQDNEAIANARTYNDRRKYKQRQKEKMRSAGLAAMRLFSEVSGVPLWQVVSFLPKKNK